MRRRMFEWMRSLRIQRWKDNQQRSAAEQRDAEERNEMREKGVMKSRMPPSGGMGY
jgi:hypothetical protein